MARLKSRPEPEKKKKKKLNTKVSLQKYKLTHLGNAPINC